MQQNNENNKHLVYHLLSASAAFRQEHQTTARPRSVAHAQVTTLTALGPLPFQHPQPLPSTNSQESQDPTLTPDASAQQEPNNVTRLGYRPYTGYTVKEINQIIANKADHKNNTGHAVYARVRGQTWYKHSIFRKHIRRFLRKNSTVEATTDPDQVNFPEMVHPVMIDMVELYTDELGADGKSAEELAARTRKNPGAGDEEIAEFLGQEEPEEIPSFGFPGGQELLSACILIQPSPTLCSKAWNDNKEKANQQKDVKEKWHELFERTLLLINTSDSEKHGQREISIEIASLFAKPRAKIIKLGDETELTGKGAMFSKLTRLLEKEEWLEQPDDFTMEDTTAEYWLGWKSKGKQYLIESSEELNTMLKVCEQRKQKAVLEVHTGESKEAAPEEDQQRALPKVK
ncbi:unnamed protein product [Zymoseptoria tritici ST99CH_1E4]|uniref:Uncharacterized protein n=1 Tax=Zymoseptoria tritici ST99CH_1E4 TaxID=1276532 RepID=A0A2H1GGX5_ZYMTR|nr:unnamed protein product [Zymoseptoria tritici ST99CH_1E4]